MPNINDLNNNLVIDAVSSNSTNNNRVVNLSSNNSNIRGKKTIVKPNGYVGTTNSELHQTQSSSRDRVDISALTPEPIQDPNIHESPVKDILEGENSIFAQYVEKKKQEAEEWSEQKMEEAEMEGIEIDETGKPIENDDSDEEFGDEDGLGFEQEEALDDYSEDDTEEDADNNMLFINDEKVDDNVSSYTVSETIIAEDDNIEVETYIDKTPKNYEDEESDEEDNNEKVEAENNDEEELIKKLQRLATERLKPVSASLNISSFTINKKATTNTNFLKQQQVKVAKWVLPNQEAVVHMKEFTGAELDQLRSFSEDTSSVSSLTRRFRTIYDHIASPKPASYDAWLKVTPFSDIDHYFFAIYIACYKGANYIPMDCSNQNCKETYLTDDIDIMDMVKFKSDKEKNKFYEIYSNEDFNANKNGVYVSEIIPLTREIALGFREPSIYGLMELSSIDNKFRDKYSDIIEYIPYIDNLYFINMEEQSLTPIGFKEYAENATKTIKSKIQKYATVLKSIDSDSFGVIKAYIKAIREREQLISYMYPETTCPKCKSTTKEIPVSAEEMVFTRHQLGTLVTTSIK